MLVGCAAEPSTEILASSNDIGLARISIQEDGDQAKVVGLDIDGRQIGVIELRRGEFVWDQDDESKGTVVDGRRMTISALDKSTSWDTAGYEPVLRMPVIPEPSLAAFVDESHVKAFLATWNIGFAERPAAGAETGFAYFEDATYGSYYYGSCGSSSCPVHNGGSTTMQCSGSPQGAVLTRDANWPYSGEDNEDVVYFACNVGYNQGGWFGKKTCAFSGVGQTTSCGTAGPNARCSGACPGFGPNSWTYSTPYQGGVSWQGGGTLHMYRGIMSGGSCSTNQQCWSGNCSGGTCS